MVGSRDWIHCRYLVHHYRAPKFRVFGIFLENLGHIADSGQFLHKLFLWQNCKIKQTKNYLVIIRKALWSYKIYYYYKMSKLTFANFVHFHMISHYHFIVQGWMQQRALILLRNILIESWDLWTPSGFYHLQKKKIQDFFSWKRFITHPQN